MKKHFNFFKNRMILSIGSMLVPVISFAKKNQDAKTILDTTYDELDKLGEQIINLVSIVGAIIGVIMLAPNLWKYLKGDPSSNDALMKVGAGIMILVILLQIIKVTLF